MQGCEQCIFYYSTNETCRYWQKRVETEFEKLGLQLPINLRIKTYRHAKTCEHFAKKRICENCRHLTIENIGASCNYYNAKIESIISEALNIERPEFLRLLPANLVPPEFCITSILDKDFNHCDNWDY